MKPETDLPLFLQTQPALARRSDETSQHSASWMRSSGVLAAQERAVFEALKAHAGMTSRELGQVLPFVDRNVTSRRLAGLADHGLVRRGSKRLCTISKMLCFTWYVNAPEKQKVGTLPAMQASRSRAEPRDTRPILSVEERIAMRERLLAEGNESQKRFLSDLEGKR